MERPIICGSSKRNEQIDTLHERGYVVVPQFVPGGRLAQLQHVAKNQLTQRAEPLEFEADVHYPGAPSSRTAVGGDTIRRLLNAYDRDPVFASWGTAPTLRNWMEDYFVEPAVLSRAHHNCLMSKHPNYGSLTGWHRDSRYWSFRDENLVSVWIALGEERIDNGGLWLVPGSHHAVFAADRFDDAKFLRSDRADNAAILETAESPRLEPGDAVLFHSKTLHSAGRNMTNAVKLSLVFTYHGSRNVPTPGTRSASMPEISLGESLIVR